MARLVSASRGGLSQHLLGSYSPSSPQGGWSKGAPWLEAFFSFYFHLSGTPTCSLGAQVLCQAAGSSRASDCSHLLHTNQHSPTILRSSSSACVLFLFIYFFLDPHCSSSSTRPWWDVLCFIFHRFPWLWISGSRDWDISSSLHKKHSLLLWETKSTSVVTSFSNSSRGILAWVTGGGFISWLQKDGFLSSIQLLN